jgi:hypothetical protein
MKRVFYFSVSFLCLALAALIGFHIGSRSVEAQSTGLSIAGYHYIDGYKPFDRTVVLNNGDIYADGTHLCNIWELSSIPQPSYPVVVLTVTGAGASSDGYTRWHVV